ncbi:Neither inactivation nor afterpotential protein G [Eumeta japonica]|uniref:Neither inactivation nor afterpotential protein G n=1 Tax=Eumeta variegata TaxID=151549 RepID=A0A4C1VWM7_EUMVA|nr:Neither inactivation nor afterpotential protein G [Eumeta japonica]
MDPICTLAVVGAGTAGCVLAARLSEDPNTKVLLIEAGDRMSYFTKIPLTPTVAQQGPYDWSVRTTPQKYSSFGLWNQSQIIPRGKGLGGSGQINFMMHGVGLPKDYERWESLGFKGWSFKDLRPYFVKAFGTASAECDPEMCSADGRCPYSSIRFENKKAASIYILKNHRELDNIFVNKEIVLAAGSVKTPQILMLSGVGPEKLLKKLKIKVIARNEQVGKNLHDHMNTPVYVSIERPISITLSKIFKFNTLWDYVWNRKGLLSFPPMAGVEYFGNSALMLFAMGSASERLMRDLSNYKHEVFRKTFPFHHSSSKEGFIFLATCTQPRSRGTVSLSDISTNTPPLVNPNYLQNGRDVKCIVKALKRIIKIVSSKPFRDIGAKIHWPRPERCQSFWNGSRTSKKIPKPAKTLNKDLVKRTTVAENDKKDRVKMNTGNNFVSDDYLECVVREVAVTGHHAGGTCAGGTVVDHKLRLKSVTGVRIMDASVMPSPTSLYPNSVLVSMAEKAAEIIKHDPAIHHDTLQKTTDRRGGGRKCVKHVRQNGLQADQVYIAQAQVSENKTKDANRCGINSAFYRKKFAEVNTIKTTQQCH